MNGARSTEEYAAQVGRRAPWLMALGYLALVALVTGLEVVSELHKFERGIYTDTFDALLVTILLTWPASLVVVHFMPYRIPPEAPLDSGYLAERALALVGAGVLQTVLLFILGRLIVRYLA